MVKGGTYKHRACHEVAFKPISVIRTPSTLKAKGFWINIVHPEAPYVIEFDRIEVKNEDLKHWKEYPIKHDY